MTDLIITPSDPDSTIDKIVSLKSKEIPDEKYIWVHLSGQIDWANEGCGFIYSNFRGAKRTLGESLDHLYGTLSFLGGGWKLEKSEPNNISYTRGNGRESIVRYDLKGPSVFDMNH